MTEAVNQSEEIVLDAKAEASPSDSEEYVCPHDDDCGYAQVVEGAPCTHSCELCEVKDSGMYPPLRSAFAPSSASPPEQPPGPRSPL